MENFPEMREKPLPGLSLQRAAAGWQTTRAEQKEAMSPAIDNLPSWRWDEISTEKLHQLCCRSDTPPSVGPEEKVLLPEDFTVCFLKML